MRRLPIFLVIDVSESMVGNHLRQMQEGVNQLIKSLRTDPHALETVYLSVIAFAGVAKTLAPLVELFAFYPPRLPIGSGTSIGAALNHLMDEIDRQVVCNSYEQKGDYKPIVYFMSDGSSTDNPEQAIARWQKYFQKRTTLVSIGIGQFADLSVLSQISAHTLRLEQCNEDDFKTFIKWISQSISSQSRSLGVDAPIVLEKDAQKSVLSLIKNVSEASAIDENYVIINGLCRKTRLPYLMKYERLPDLNDIPVFKNQTPQVYRFVGVYPVEADYLEWSDTRVNTHTVAASMLEGGGGCPHCGATYGLVKCGNCQQIFCTNDEEQVVCPKCQQHLRLSSSGGDFDITRARG